VLNKYFADRAFEHGSAWRMADIKGASSWLPPGLIPTKKRWERYWPKAWGRRATTRPSDCWSK
jgi:hypothetical protein